MFLYPQASHISVMLFCFSVRRVVAYRSLISERYSQNPIPMFCLKIDERYWGDTGKVFATDESVISWGKFSFINLTALVAKEKLFVGENV